MDLPSRYYENLIESFPKELCEKFVKMEEVFIPQRPYRCLNCDSIFFALEGSVQPHHGEYPLPTPTDEPHIRKGYCPGTGIFAGLSDEEMANIGNHLDSQRHRSLQEGHNWERGVGGANIHAIPQNPETMKVMRDEGRIRDIDGVPHLISKDKRQYKESLKMMGQDNPDGDGNISKSRQRGEEYGSQAD